MSIKKKHLEKYLDFALKSVKKSEAITMKYYSKKVKHRVKDNNSPVTIADIKCEDFLREKIKEKFKEHDIFGEERGSAVSGSEFKWIIDPVDGTKNFMRKYPYWGTLLALEYAGDVVLGVISMPVLKETYYAAKNMGCYRNSKKVKVSKIKAIEDSYLIHGGIDYFFKEHDSRNFEELALSCYYSRGFGDCHGHTLVINGQAELMADPHVAPYDVAPVKICIEEAGGMFTDLNGVNTIYGGSALVSNGNVHSRALEILNRNLESREITKV